ncbi:MAG: acetylserotonin O-methyltransferase [Burkholderiaceae bacterium]|jgi:SAM-dependent methyltransferase|nr:acetylserotonin O-methyltransferase [Burkholderiaceae bacterium]
MSPAAMPDPAPIVRLSTAYWESQALLTANRLRIFDFLADGARSAEEVAAGRQLDPRSTGLLLRACVGLGFLVERGQRFENAPVASAFLVSHSPAFMGNVIRYSDQLYGAWGQLEDAVRSGRPAVPAQTYLGDDPGRTRAFVQAMHERALGIARALVPMLDLSGRRTMLDVGGGPGTYSVLLTERFAGLRAEVLELPGVAAVARELVAAAGAQDRVTLRDGDYHSSDFGSGRDVVLMSGMFHRETAQTCRDLVRRAVACLNPGGLLVVSDVFTDAGGCQPVFAAMFGLNMMLTAPDGGVHADADVTQWMAECGLQALKVSALPPPMPHRIVSGVKP